MADSELCSTSQWIQFFRNAGLPPNVAANYAIIFSDNRIQQNMLMDLSKEYLYDMGIKVMGDVIAILKYSKEFHNQLAQEKIMGNNLKFSSSPKRSSPATRILGHYTRPVTTTAAAPNEPVQLSTNAFQKAQINNSKKRILTSNKDTSPHEGNVVKKVRRVLPEEEGGYRIKMPTGTTERTRKILEQQTILASKKSVFQRLGDSDVSSSTDAKRNMNSGSVFNRLGPSTNEVSTSTIDQAKDAPLTYQGVLKSTKKISKIVTPTTRESVLGRISMGPKPLIVNRLGSKPVVQAKRTVLNNATGSHGVMQINSILQRNAQLNSVRGLVIDSSHGILGRKPGVPARRTPITQRLGTKSTVIVSTNQSLREKPIFSSRSSNQLNRLQQSSVFQRLGK